MIRNKPVAWMILLVLLVFAAGGTTALAAPETPAEPEMETEEPLRQGPLFHRPDLTDAQCESLKQLHGRFMEETRDLHLQIRQRRLALAAEMAKKIPDAAAAGKIQADLSELKGQLDEKRLENWLEAKKIAPYIDLPPWHHRHGPEHGFGRDF